MSSSSLTVAVLCCSMAVLVLSQQMMDEPTADKRVRSFAFAKRSPYRTFAFAKRDASDEEDVDMEKRARFAFAKRGGYRQFAFAKRASPYGFAFAKRGLSSFA